MATHRRAVILDKLREQLEKIYVHPTPPESWALDSKPRVQLLKASSFSLTYFPHILIIPVGERKANKVTAGARYAYDSFLEVQIEGWSRAEDIVAADNAMLHDIEMACGLDVQLDRTCIQLSLLGNENMIEDEARPRSGVRVLAEIHYRHFGDKPSEGAP